MKSIHFFGKKRIFLIAILVFLFILPSFSYFVTYKEQYYRLFHVHYQQYPDDIMENIYWLEKAVAADFSNPKYALTKIDDEKDWEKYRSVFMMHLNLKLIEQHLRLGGKYDKGKVYFYDAPFREALLFELERAESCYQAGLYYWREAKLWAEKASEKKFYFLNLSGIQNWEDERERIINGKLNYEKIITRELKRIAENKAYLLAMDENTY